MPTSCRRMFALKRSSTPKSRHSRRDAAVDRQNQNMELPITLPADHPLRLGNFTSAHLGTFESALTVEGRIRQRPTFPANLQPPIRKVIDLDHFAAKANCQAFRLKRQLHATVVHHQLVRHLTLLTPTQNLIEILPGIDRTMKVLIAGRGLGKAA